MAVHERSPFNPFTFDEIGLAVGELADLGCAFAVLAVEGAGGSIFASIQR